MLRRLFPDNFLFLLLGVIAVAILLPAQGSTLHMVAQISQIAIFSLFFFHGLRLPHQAVWAAIKEWRTHIGILAFSFCLMPLLGFGISRISALALPSELAAGLLFLGFLPSTVQSAIAYTAIADGEVAVSVVAAAASNLLAILITPALLLLGGQASGLLIEPSQIIRIATLLLLPFILGQLARFLLSQWAEDNRGWISKLDKLTICLAVYSAFSSASAEGVWQRVTWSNILVLGVFALLLFAIAASVIWQICKLAHIPRRRQIAVLFAGSHKSLATGAPMAGIFFPAAQAGILILPLILYHQIQLIGSALIAARLASQPDEAHSDGVKD